MKTRREKCYPLNNRENFDNSISSFVFIREGGIPSPIQMHLKIDN